MLDTNVLSDVIRDPIGKVARQLALRIDAALSAIEVLPFAVPADTEYGKLRAQLAAKEKPIDPNALLIAAHALSLGLILVTDNVLEFRRVTGLSVLNWRK